MAGIDPTTLGAQPTMAELQAALAAAQAKIATLASKAAGTGKLTVKVSAKGAVSVYGLGRWPVTLYASQMERFLGHAEEIKAFMAANRGKLAVKPTE